jgi:hypothetical protein
MLIEEWPVELWLELFVYMSTRDLVVGWFDLNIHLNRIIERVLSLGLHQFDLDESWTHENFMNCVEHVYPRLAPYVSNIILRDTFAAQRLVIFVLSISMCVDYYSAIMLYHFFHSITLLIYSKSHHYYTN